MGKTPKEIREETPTATPQPGNVIHVSTSELDNESEGILIDDVGRLASNSTFPDKSILTTAPTPNNTSGHIQTLNELQDFATPLPGTVTVVIGLWVVKRNKKAYTLARNAGSTVYEIIGYDYDGNDLSTMELDGNTLDISSDVGTAEDFCMDYEGDNIYVADSNDETIKQLKGDIFDLSSFTFTIGDELDISSGGSNPRAIHFNPNMKELMVLGDTSNAITKWTLTTRKEINTGSKTGGNFDISSITTSPMGMWVNDKGSIIYLISIGSPYFLTEIPLFDYWNHESNPDLEGVDNFDLAVGTVATEIFLDETTNDFFVVGNVNIFNWKFGIVSDGNAILNNSREISREQGTTPTYSSQTYKVNDLVSHAINGGPVNVYRNITEITVGESFTPGKWSRVSPDTYWELIATEILDVKNSVLETIGFNRALSNYAQIKVLVNAAFQISDNTTQDIEFSYDSLVSTTRKFFWNRPKLESTGGGVPTYNAKWEEDIATILLPLSGYTDDKHVAIQYEFTIEPFGAFSLSKVKQTGSVKGVLIQAEDMTTGTPVITTPMSSTWVDGEVLSGGILHSIKINLPNADVGKEFLVGSSMYVYGLRTTPQ